MSFLHWYLEANPGLVPSVLPSPAGKPIGHADVENRMIPIHNDVDPEVVIAWQHQMIRDVSTSLDMTNRGHRCNPRNSWSKIRDFWGAKNFEKSRKKSLPAPEAFR